jgi:tetratricopeptide (TPR) repeat protein
VAQGLRRDPDSGYLHALSAQVALARGDAAAAVAACDRAIAADARLAEAWACRGEALFEAGDPDGAEASLSRALELGEDAALLYNRATARLAIGQAAGAITDLERAAELQPDDEDVTELLDQARGELAGSAS